MYHVHQKYIKNFVYLLEYVKSALLAAIRNYRRHHVVEIFELF